MYAVVFIYGKIYIPAGKIVIDQSSVGLPYSPLSRSLRRRIVRIHKAFIRSVIPCDDDNPAGGNAVRDIRTAFISWRIIVSDSMVVRCGTVVNVLIRGTVYDTAGKGISTINSTVTEFYRLLGMVCIEIGNVHFCRRCISRSD